MLRVCYFRFKNPPGYVEHIQPRSFFQMFFISVGPLIMGSLISFLLFVSVVFACRGAINRAPTIGMFITGLLPLWFAVSIAISCFPSQTDAKVLLSETNRHLFKRFNPLAIIGYPFVLVIKISNYLKRFYFNWVYAIFLLAIAIYVILFWIK